MPSNKYEFIVNGKVKFTCFSKYEVNIYTDLLDANNVKFELITTSLL